MPLSGICRQLYFDTSLLPYQLNVWIFASHSAQTEFIAMDRRISLAPSHSFKTMIESGIRSDSEDRIPEIYTTLISKNNRLMVSMSDLLWVPVQGGSYRRLAKTLITSIPSYDSPSEKPIRPYTRYIWPPGTRGRDADSMVEVWMYEEYRLLP